VTHAAFVQTRHGWQLVGVVVLLRTPTDKRAMPSSDAHRQDAAAHGWFLVFLRPCILLTRNPAAPLPRAVVCAQRTARLVPLSRPRRCRSLVACADEAEMTQQIDDDRRRSSHNTLPLAAFFFVAAWRPQPRMR
jgi:hypothetical protein